MAYPSIDELTNGGTGSVATTVVATTQPRASSNATDRGGSGCTGPEDERPGFGQGDHGATSSMSWAQSPQSVPPSHDSRFQMGTVRLRVSMQ